MFFYFVFCAVTVPGDGEINLIIYSRPASNFLFNT